MLCRGRDEGGRKLAAAELPEGTESIAKRRETHCPPGTVRTGTANDSLPLRATLQEKPAKNVGRRLRACARKDAPHAANINHIIVQDDRDRG